MVRHLQQYPRSDMGQVHAIAMPGCAAAKHIPTHARTSIKTHLLTNPQVLQNVLAFDAWDERASKV